MSETGAPPGWYVDSGDPSSYRWWNGTSWTDERFHPDAPIPKAPEGTRWNTVWIWLVIATPILPLIPFLFIDWSSLFSADLTDPAAMVRAQLALYFSPPMIIAVIGGWLAYGLTVVFAYLDYRELRRRGVPRPFHWAWTFLYSIAYTIGRSIVVKRRTGHGHAPIWVEVGAIVLMFMLVIVMMVQMFSAIALMIPGYITR